MSLKNGFHSIFHRDCFSLWCRNRKKWLWYPIFAIAKIANLYMWNEPLILKLWGITKTLFTNCLFYWILILWKLWFIKWKIPTWKKPRYTWCVFQLFMLAIVYCASSTSLLALVMAFNWHGFSIQNQFYLRPENGIKMKFYLNKIITVV